MFEERRIRIRTPEWRAIYDRIQVAMELTSRLNVLPFSDLDSRNALFGQLLGKPLPEKAIIHPPFYSTYDLGIEPSPSSRRDTASIRLSAMTSSPWHRSSSNPMSGLGD